MSFFHKPLESIEESDLQALKDNQVPEGKTIEYKLTLPGTKDRDKKEFLADVFSFANASGGDLIFGIKEDSGIPKEICGLPDIDPDSTILDLENRILSGIAPRIPGKCIRHIPLQGSSSGVIIIRIPKSWASPHMVTFKNDSKFYSRNSKGKYQLDVSEIRAAFLISETAAERIRRFRAERLGKIVAGESPAALREEIPKTVIHIIPLKAFDPSVSYDLTSLRFREELKPMTSYIGFNSSFVSTGYSYNLDGLLTHDIDIRSGQALTYLQIFRNGSVEAVENHLLQIDEGKFIRGGTFERMLFQFLPKYFSLQESMGVEPPVFIMLSLLGVSGYEMAYTSDSDMDNVKRFYNIHPIDRDALLIPEVIVESFEHDLDEIMRPMLDRVWNATGWPRSYNFDETGRCKGKRDS